MADWPMLELVEVAETKYVEDVAIVMLSARFVLVTTPGEAVEVVAALRVKAETDVKLVPTP